MYTYIYMSTYVYWFVLLTSDCIQGNWNNFRNERLNHSEEICIDEDYMALNPVSGVLEFDYVSTTRPPLNAEVITTTEMETLMLDLQLAQRRRLHRSKANFKLLELQVAVTKYYFLTSHVLVLLDCFTQDDSIQVK